MTTKMQQYHAFLREYHWLRVLAIVKVGKEKREIKARMQVLERRLDETKPTPDSGSSVGDQPA